MRLPTELPPNDVYETLRDCCATGEWCLIPVLLRFVPIYNKDTAGGKILLFLLKHRCVISLDTVSCVCRDTQTLRLESRGSY